MKTTGLFYKYLFVIIVIFIAICLSMFHHWEPSVESWGYWLFSRIWQETGKFIIIERSPPYTIYLSLFRWIGYPLSVEIEYIVTTLIASIALFSFSRIFFKTPFALLATILWIPYMQVSEPPTQKLALTCSIIGFFLRYKQAKNAVAKSYFFFGLAYLFRPTYLVFIASFIGYDLLRYILQYPTKRPRIRVLDYWPIALILLIYGYFSLMQSNHPWNSSSFATTKWFPFTLKRIEILGNLNTNYIQKNFYQIEVPDFYYTNDLAFNGAQTLREAYLAQPDFVTEFIKENIRNSIPIIAAMTSIPSQISSVNVTNINLSSIFLVMLGALFRSKKNGDLFIFVLASYGLIFISVIFTLMPRYLFPLIPVYIVAASWWSNSISRFLTKVIKLKKDFFFIPIVVLLLFSNNNPVVRIDRKSGWPEIFEHAYKSYLTGSIKNELLVDDKVNIYSSAQMKRSYEAINEHLPQCKGLMTFEYGFIAAYMDIPIKSVFDIWEVPPFGTYGNEAYIRLTPDQVNCVFVSHNMEQGMGMPTNHRIRYENYLVPYIEYLKTIGAEEIKIPSYGRLIILAPDN